jgi:hypothetical protein
MPRESNTDEWRMVHDRIRSRIAWYGGDQAGYGLKSMAEGFCDERIVQELRELLQYMDAIA